MSDTTLTDADVQRLLRPKSDLDRHISILMGNRVQGAIQERKLDGSDKWESWDGLFFDTAHHQYRIIYPAEVVTRELGGACGIFDCDRCQWDTIVISTEPAK